ncbi:MAG: hypothetical protein ACT4NY_32780 [Pseudonocardiales bacterium]
MREIRWTEHAEAHIARHQVTADEVEQVVNSRPRWSAPGRQGAELIHGCTDSGRFLLVVLSEAPDGRYDVRTARDLTDSERRTYQRKAR